MGVPSTLVVSPPDVAYLLATLTTALGPAHEPTAQWSADVSRLALGDVAFAKQAWLKSSGSGGLQLQKAVAPGAARS